MEKANAAEEEKKKSIRDAQLEREQRLKNLDPTPAIARSMLLHDHKNESVDDIIKTSQVLDAKHCPPKRRKAQAKRIPLQSVTIFSSPAASQGAGNLDPWDDEISETGYLQLSRKCAVSIDFLKEIHEDWHTITKSKKKGMATKQFSKLCEKWFPHVTRDEIEAFAEEYFWAIDLDEDERCSFSEAVFGLSITMHVSRKDPLLVLKKQLMGYHSDDVMMMHRLLDDGRRGYVTQLNLYKFFGESLSGYRCRKRLADSLYSTIMPPDPQADPESRNGMSIERFVEKVSENHNMWHIFQTCLQLKYMDQELPEYTDSREALIKWMNETRKNGQYLFQRTLGEAPSVSLADL